MDRRNRPKKHPKKRQIPQEISNKLSMEEKRDIQLKKQCYLNSQALAAIVENEMKHGSNVKIVASCKGCRNCNGEKECYVVEVDKKYEAGLEKWELI